MKETHRGASRKVIYPCAGLGGKDTWSLLLHIPPFGQGRQMHEARGDSGFIAYLILFLWLML